MKRQVRRSFRKIERTFSQAKSCTASFFERSFSSYQSNHHSLPIPPTPRTVLTDSDDDLVFEGTTDGLPMDDTESAAATPIPCEFCHLPQTVENIARHQMVCTQNPHYPRRRNATPNRTIHGRRRRTVSDSASPLPSAPPRTRSPSPTEGFPIPIDLVCPITHQLFSDPVVASDGHTYEREAIVRCLQSQKVSPITREPISVDKLNPNRIVKKMVDDFRAECKRKKSLYKYKLDVDLKKSEQVPYIKTNSKSIYRAEWIKKNSLSTNSNIILIHLNGENAEKIADMNCRLGPHPNIVRVLGRVEHNDTGVLLVQECPTTKTLSQFMKNTEQKLSIAILDHIFYQIASALQHLNNVEIIYGNLIADNILIYHLDEIPEHTLIKLTNIMDTEKSTNDINNGQIAPEILSTNVHTEKSAVYAFGVLAKEMYSLELETDDNYSTERLALLKRCLETDPIERPTLNELSKILNDFINTENCF